MNLTIADNIGPAATPAGLLCVGGACTVVNSVLWLNGAGGPAQCSGCTYRASSSSDAKPPAGARRLAPAFVAPAPGVTLERAEAAVGTDIGDFEPIAVVLYGDEGRMFARDAYAANKYAVDLAARLDALRVVDIQICELWLDESGLTHSDMLPFVGFVPDGEAAVAELRRDGYRYF